MTTATTSTPSICAFHLGQAARLQWALLALAIRDSGVGNVGMVHTGAGETLAHLCQLGEAGLSRQFDPDTVLSAESADSTVSVETAAAATEVLAYLQAIRKYPASAPAETASGFVRDIDARLCRALMQLTCSCANTRQSRPQSAQDAEGA